MRPQLDEDVHADGHQEAPNPDGIKTGIEELQEYDDR